MPKPFPALDGVASSHCLISAWGNLLGNIPSQTFCLCFQNIGGLSYVTESESEIKLQSISQFINSYQVNAFTFLEHNTCWDLLAPDKCVPGLTKGWWENAHWSISHNCLDKNQGIYQPGSAGLVVVNSFSHNALWSGSDLLGLGWWSWVKLHGSQTHHTQIVSMYCPCKSSGPLATYQQHLWALGCPKHDVCPKKAILSDLATDIRTWQTDGEAVVVLVDFNEDVHSPELTQFFWEFDLVEVVTGLHLGTAPVTYNCGSFPIDGILCQLASSDIAMAAILTLGRVHPATIG